VVNISAKDGESIRKVLELSHKGEYLQAVEISENILQENHHNLEARFILSNLYLEIGEYNKADALLEYFSKVNPGPLTQIDLLYLTQGLWIYARRQGKKDLFHKVVSEFLPRIEKLEPKNPWLYVFWGNCYLDKYDIPSAGGCFRDALKIDGSFPEALLGQAKIHLISETPTDILIAISLINQILETTTGTNASSISITPVKVEGWNLLASAQLSNEHFADALNSINKVLDINPNSITSRAMKASIYYLSNNITGFEKTCQEILSLNKRPARFYLIIADHLERKLLYQDATSFYERAVEFDKNLLSAQIGLGFNYLHLGPEFEEKGKKILNEMFERDPFNIRIYNMLKVLDALEEEFVSVKSKYFEVKLHKNEQFLLEPYIIELLDNAYEKFGSLYHYKPITPVLVEAFPNYNDFSVRTIGLPGFLGGGARGVCFAKTFLILSPKAQEQMGQRFHWGSVSIHEFMHIITLQLSKFRVPRWFTEGCSVYSQKLFNPVWGADIEDEIAKALSENKLQRFSDFIRRPQIDILHTYYLSSLIIEYIHNKYGMDKIIAMLKSWGEFKNTETVFRDCLGKTIAQFDEEFFNYLTQDFMKDINYKEFEQNFRKARELLKRNKIPEAIEEFIKAKQSFAGYTKAGDNPYYYLSSIYEELGETDKMYSEIESLIKINEKDFANRLKLARHYRSQKQYNKLVELLKETVYLESESIQVHSYLAEGYYNLKNYNSALQEYNIAIELVLKLPASEKKNIALCDFYCSMTQIYLELNDRNKAGELLDKAKQSYPDYKRIKELMDK
jgi:tetratricopeptide (TPR) repeat protein